MAAAQYDFVIEQGTTFVKSFRWKDSNGDPINLNGYSALMHVRTSITSDNVLLELSTENKRIQVIPEEGKLDLVLSSTETSAIDWKKGRYDIELISDTGTVTRLVHGVISISKEITRA